MEHKKMREVKMTLLILGHSYISANPLAGIVTIKTGMVTVD
jgi:hypothetical protein